MNKIRVFGTGTLFLLLIALAAAELPVTDYETTSVSRIVGDSPYDLLNQLEGEDLDLEHATYLTQMTKGWNTQLHTQKYEMLRKNIGDVNAGGLDSFNYDCWKYDYIDDLLHFEENELFVLEADEGDSPMVSESKCISGSELDPDDTLSWVNDFKRYNPLFIFDSPYAGLYIPGEDSFVANLAPHSIMIAPTAYNSKEFVKSFLCNMRNDRNVGEIFRQTRNNYYWGVDSDDELVGLTMLSYSMYGDPNLKARMDSYDQSVIDDYCENYDTDYPKNKQALTFTITELETSSLEAQAYMGLFTFNIYDYEVVSEGNHSIIEADTTEQNYMTDELVLPKQVVAEEYPLRTVVRNVSVVSLEDPVYLTVEDLPMWNGNYTERVCYQESQEASVEFSHSFTENSEAVLVTINPAEVLNCTEGRLKLYTKVRYKIEYLPFSPILIDEIYSDRKAAPAERIEVGVLLKNIGSKGEYGNLVVKDGESILSQTGVFVYGAQTKEFTLPLDVPEEYGIKTFTVEFLQDEETKTHHDFDVVIDDLTLELSTVSKISIGDALPVLVRMDNRMDSFDTNLTVLLSGNGKYVEERRALSLSNGDSTEAFIFNTTSLQAGYYSIDAYLEYNGVNETDDSMVLIAETSTQVAPILDSFDDITVMEGEKITIMPYATDLNGDYIAYTFSSPVKEDGTWQTGIGDIGEYTISVTASDGYSSDTKQVRVIIIENTEVVDTFANGEKEDYVSFFGEGNQTMFIKILKNTRITSASLKVSGE